MTPEELQFIASTIYNNSSSRDQRQTAENRLLSFEAEHGSWITCASMLSNTRDIGQFFFLSLCLHRIVWKRWTYIPLEEREYITNAVLNTLSTQQGLPKFARSKAEQVLSAICKSNLDFNAVLKLVVGADQPGFLVGISALRTVLEDCLDNADTRVAHLAPEDRLLMVNLALNNIAGPATGLACEACVRTLQGSTSSSPDEDVLDVSLDLLRVIVARIPLGAHISEPLLDLLFGISALAAESVRVGGHQGSATERASCAAVVVLTEIIGLRLIPSQRTQNTDNTGGNDIGASVLLGLVSRAVGLLTAYRSRAATSSKVVLNVLHFIALFAENHLERCCASSFLSSDGMTSFVTELIQLSCCSRDVEYASRVAEMWEALLAQDAVLNVLHSPQSISTTPAEAAETGYVSSGFGGGLCADMVEHLVLTALVSPVNGPLHYAAGKGDTNDESTLLLDLVADLQMEPFTDAHTRSVASHLLLGSMTSSVGTGGRFADDAKVEGAEENASAIGTLRKALLACLSELVTLPEVRLRLSQRVPGIFEACLQILLALSSSSGSNRRKVTLGSILDAQFLIRVLSMITPAPELLEKLALLLPALIARHALLSNGDDADANEDDDNDLSRASAALFLACTQVAGQLLSSQCSGARHIEVVSAVLFHIFNAAVAATNAHVVDTAGLGLKHGNVILIATYSLLLQISLVIEKACQGDPHKVMSVETLSAISNAFLTQLLPFAGIISNNLNASGSASPISLSVLSLQCAMSLESRAILICAADVFLGHEISAVLVRNLVELAGPSVALWEQQRDAHGCAEALLKVASSLGDRVACVDARARHAAHAASATRVRFAQIITPSLQNLLPHLLSVATQVLRLLRSTATTAQYTTMAATSHTYALAGSLVLRLLSLGSGVLLGAGRKTFSICVVECIQACQPLWGIDNDVLALKSVVSLCKSLTESVSHNDNAVAEQAIVVHSVLTASYQAMYRPSNSGNYNSINASSSNNGALNVKLELFTDTVNTALAAIRAYTATTSKPGGGTISALHQSILPRVDLSIPSMNIGTLLVQLCAGCIMAAEQKASSISSVALVLPSSSSSSSTYSPEETRAAVGALQGAGALGMFFSAWFLGGQGGDFAGIASANSPFYLVLRVSVRALALHSMPALREPLMALLATLLQATTISREDKCDGFGAAAGNGTYIFFSFAEREVLSLSREYECERSSGRGSGRGSGGRSGRVQGDCQDRDRGTGGTPVWETGLETLMNKSRSWHGQHEGGGRGDGAVGTTEMMIEEFVTKVLDPLAVDISRGGAIPS